VRNDHLVAYVNDTPWALSGPKLQAVVRFLRDRVSGSAVADAELEAFAGPKSAGATQQGAVAILPVRGVIAHRAGMLEESSGGVSTESLAKSYRQLMADPNVGTIVLDMDTPGGAVAGVHELATEMLATKGTKKVIAVANSLLASAGYWLAAAAADEIVAIPSASVGSIGVASIYIDDSKQRENEGVAVEVFTSAENKAEVLGLGPLSDEAKARRQARVDEAGNWFRADVAKGRGVSVADVRAKFGEGIVFGAKDAKALGLVDRIATMDEVIGRLVGRKSAGGMRAEGVSEETLAEMEQFSRDNPELAARLIEEETDRRRRLRLL
jgi:signal peptide peptidase SppA